MNYVLELGTDSGPVLVRLGYFNLRAGRQYLAQTVELEPTSGYLLDSVATRIRAAIGARGGLQPNPWIVHYGDG